MFTDFILDRFTRKWWTLLLRGVFAMLFGVLAFTMPGVTLTSLVLLYGIYAFMDGLVGIWLGATAGSWGLALSGVVSILAGIFTFAFPATAATVLVYVIGFWAVFRGVLEILLAVQVRKVIENEWIFILGGILSILAGAVLCLSPLAGALAMVWVIGAYACAYGVLQVIFAFRLKTLAGRVRNAFKGA